MQRTFSSTAAEVAALSLGGFSGVEHDRGLARRGELHRLRAALYALAEPGAK
jgi:hypothetical protein